MLIGELVQLAGVTRDTIRYYERRGLLEVTHRRENQYKEYAPNSPERLTFIQDLQDMGFTLAETQTFLTLIERNAATCANTGPTIAARLAAIDDKIARLHAMRERLVTAFKACSRSPKARKSPCAPIAGAFKKSRSRSAAR